MIPLSDGTREASEPFGVDEVEEPARRNLAAGHLNVRGKGERENEREKTVSRSKGGAARCK